MTVIALKLRNLAHVLPPRLVPSTDRVGSAATLDGRLVASERRPRPFSHEVIAVAFQTELLMGAAAGMWKCRHQAGHVAR